MQCQRKENISEKNKDKQCSSEIRAARVARRSDTLLDVSRLRLQTHRESDATRHGLDMDAAVAAVRYHGTALQRHKMEADPGAGGREATPLHMRQRHLPVIRRKSRDTPGGRVYTLRSVEEMRRSVVSESLGDGGHGASHRHAARDDSDGSDAAGTDDNL